jgi:hypothetical protein
MLDGAVAETRMDRLSQFLTDMRKGGLAPGQFRGLLHILIGRRIESADGTLVSAGQTWRGAAALLKKHRFDKKLALELGLQLGDLPPRQRERFWYVVINHGEVNSEAARSQSDDLAVAAKALGYIIGAAPFA